MTDLLPITPPPPPDPFRPLGTLGQILNAVEEADRLARAATAIRAGLIDDARMFAELLVGLDPEVTERDGWTPDVRGRRELVFDLAARLRIPERSAENLVGESKVLVWSLASTLGYLREGYIEYGHAKVIIEVCGGLKDEVQRGFEIELLGHAIELTVPKFKALARRLREALDPHTADKRHRDAVEERRVYLDPQEDGMSLLSVLTTAEKAAAAHDRITRIALALGAVEAAAEGAAGDGVGATDAAEPDTRTLAQKRADVFADLLIDGDLCETGEPAAHGIRPNVLVTVPVLTLVGAEEIPGTLEGYGPIAPETARDLAARAPSFARILTDPVSSAILDFDRSKYAVPADLRTIIRLQNETCTAPGCTRPASQCDYDHTVAWQDGGTTCLSNLSPLCRTHHNLKHHTRVQLRNLGNGQMEWTTPTGHVAVTRPTTELGAGMLKRGSPRGAEKTEPPPPEALPEPPPSEQSPPQPFDS
ncbi:hypothetical protein HD599_000064 [Conyzicola lurida]|uniref:HNH nuclease domain-containing protein n=1 Tax=Conyzicola lurida TaxID=1172621 RepID=A0A841AJ66_9MICO|nr:HNH endonuclease signature motif containing protein [Conyzicola lurida]MBB5841741.1 hypothetical protein [Conyzicola lurida]